jgi:hypothetical protein
MVDLYSGIEMSFGVRVDEFNIIPEDISVGAYEQKEISYTILVTLSHFDDGKLQIDKKDRDLPDYMTQSQLDRFESKLIKLHEEYLKSEYSEGEL